MTEEWANPCIWITKPQKKHNDQFRNMSKYYVDCDRCGVVTERGQTTFEYAIERAKIHDCGCEIWGLEKDGTKWKATFVSGDGEVIKGAKEWALRDAIRSVGPTDPS